MEAEVQPPAQQSLLHELDARQNQLLDELDQLNSRIENLLREWTGSRDADHPCD